MRRWYAVYTKPGQERLAEGNLAAQGFETYLPRLLVRRRHARKSVSRAVPMFSRYLFVRLDIEAGPWRAVNSTFGVANLVSFGDCPAPLPDAVIVELRRCENADGVISLADVAPFQPGETVEITDGPMAETRALFTAQTDRERVIVMTLLLGRRIPVSVRCDQLRRAS